MYDEFSHVQSKEPPLNTLVKLSACED